MSAHCSLNPTDVYKNLFFSSSSKSDTVETIPVYIVKNAYHTIRYFFSDYFN